MQTQFITLVENAVRQQLQQGAAFTALDVSNSLKSRNFPVRHSDVAAVVRDVYGSGAMDAYNYRRTHINVTTDNGSKKTQAWLYLPQPARQRDYAARTQNALPPVPADRARALPDAAPAAAGSVLPRSAGKYAGRGRTRRDGALSLPLSVVRQMGWTAGVTLSVNIDAGRLTVRAGGGGVRLRVWDGERVRVCRRTLSLGGLRVGRVTWDVQGGVLHLVAL